MPREEPQAPTDHDARVIHHCTTCAEDFYLRDHRDEHLHFGYRDTPDVADVTGPWCIDPEIVDAVINLENALCDQRRHEFLADVTNALRPGGGLASAAAPALSQPVTADTHPMVGTWHGTRASGDGSKVTIAQAGEQRNVHRALGHDRPRRNAFGVVGFHPETGIEANVLDDTLQFEAGRTKFGARLGPADPDVLVLARPRQGKTRTTSNARTAPPARTVTS